MEKKLMQIEAKIEKVLRKEGNKYHTGIPNRNTKFVYQTKPKSCNWNAKLIYQLLYPTHNCRFEKKGKIAEGQDTVKNRLRETRRKKLFVAQNQMAKKNVCKPASTGQNKLADGKVKNMTKRWNKEKLVMRD